VLGAVVVASVPAQRDEVKRARSNVAEDGKTYRVIAVRISR